MSADQKMTGFLADGVARKGLGDEPKRVQLVGISEFKARVGETHHSAKYSETLVDAIRDAYEAGQDGTGPKLGYTKLAAMFDVPRRTVRGFCDYSRRNSWVAKWVKPRARGAQRSRVEG